jgi:hypothetical protein
MEQRRKFISFDYAIRLFLRNRISFEVLEGFLSEVMEEKILVKNIRKSDCGDGYQTDTSIIVDIIAEDETFGEIFIELSYMSEYDFRYSMKSRERKTINERIVQTPDFKNVKWAYSINIIPFDLGKGKDYVYHTEISFTGLHTKGELKLPSSKCLTKGLDIGYHHPEYYLLEVNNFDDEVKDKLDEWIYFLKNNIIEDKFKAKGLEKAREVLDINNLTPEEREEYDRLIDIHNRNMDIVALKREQKGKEKKK